MHMLRRRISTCFYGLEERTTVVRRAAYLLPKMGDLVTGPADDLFRCEPVLHEKRRVRPDDFEIVHVDDDDFIVETVEHRSKKFVRTLEVPGAFSDPPLERFVQKAQLVFSGFYPADGILRQTDDNENEEGASQKHGAGYEFGGKRKAAGQNDDEHHVSGQKKEHEADHYAPSTLQLGRNMAAHLLAQKDCRSHEKCADQNEKGRHRYQCVHITSGRSESD